MTPLAFQRPYLPVFAAAVLVWAVPEVAGSFLQGAPEDATVRDRRSKAVLMGSLALAGFAAVLAATSVPAATVRPFTAVVFGFGVGLLVAGTALRWYAVRVLGEFFTREVAVQAGQSVVDDGPYGVVRHPAYTGSVLSMLGLGLALTNWVSLAAVVVLAGVGYGYRIRVEERALRDELGDPYRAYQRETPYRLVPFVW